MFRCSDCDAVFDDFGIEEFGSGAVLSKVEVAICPKCGSSDISEIRVIKPAVTPRPQMAFAGIGDFIKESIAAGYYVKPPDSAIMDLLVAPPKAKRESSYTPETPEQRAQRYKEQREFERANRECKKRKKAPGKHSKNKAKTAEKSRRHNRSK